MDKPFFPSSEEPTVPPAANTPGSLTAVPVSPPSARGSITRPPARSVYPLHRLTTESSTSSSPLDDVPRSRLSHIPRLGTVTDSTQPDLSIKELTSTEYSDDEEDMVRPIIRHPLRATTATPIPKQANAIRRALRESVSSRNLKLRGMGQRFKKLPSSFFHHRSSAISYRNGDPKSEDTSLQIDATVPDSSTLPLPEIRTLPPLNIPSDNTVPKAVFKDANAAEDQACRPKNSSKESNLQDGVDVAKTKLSPHAITSQSLAEFDAKQTTATPSSYQNSQQRLPSSHGPVHRSSRNLPENVSRASAEALRQHEYPGKSQWNPSRPAAASTRQGSSTSINRSIASRSGSRPSTVCAGDSIQSLTNHAPQYLYTELPRGHNDFYFPPSAKRYEGLISNPPLPSSNTLSIQTMGQSSSGKNSDDVSIAQVIDYQNLPKPPPFIKVPVYVPIRVFKEPNVAIAPLLPPIRADSALGYTSPRPPVASNIHGRSSFESDVASKAWSTTGQVALEEEKQPDGDLNSIYNVEDYCW